LYKSVGFAVSLLSATNVAVAADLSLKGSAPATVYDWSGLYVGGNAGVGFGRADYRNINNTTLFGDALPPASFSHDMNRPIGGLQAGWNWQFSRLMAGVEATWSPFKVSGRQATAFGVIDDQFTTAVSNLLLLSGRVGVAMDTWLFYVKGGYAGGEVRASVNDTQGPNQGSGSSSGWQHGYNLGLGVELGLSGSWRAGLQYDFVDLGSATRQLAGDSPGSYLWDVSIPQLHLITMRVNYRLN
jgi:outer membrane immunogenic protein